MGTVLNLYVLAFSGLLLHWLYNLNNALHKPDFDLKFFAKDNWFKMMVGAAMTFVIVYAKEDLTKWVTVTPIVAFFGGYLSSDLFYNFLKFFKKLFGNLFSKVEDINDVEDDD
jgi:hypothetical protein